MYLIQVYAIACQIGGRDIVGDDEFAAGHKFHQRALALGYPLALCTESLQGLQYLLLMVSWQKSCLTKGSLEVYTSTLRHRGNIFSQHHSRRYVGT